MIVLTRLTPAGQRSIIDRKARGMVATTTQRH